MEAAESNNVEQLDPAYVGSAASAPLAGVTRRLLLQQQTEQKALENAAAMTQRAEQMFLFLPDGLHSSGMLPVRVKASNSLLEGLTSTRWPGWPEAPPRTDLANYHSSLKLGLPKL